MSARGDPGKRIPKSLNTDAGIIGGYTLADVALALSPGVAVVLVFQWVLSPSLTLGGYGLDSLVLPLAGVGVLVGSVFVVLTPGYTSSLGWLAAALGYHRRESTHEHASAREQTRYERVHADQNAIERADGTLVAPIEVSAPMLALATPGEWQQHAESFAEFCNTTLEFPLQIYSTTRDVPVEEYLGHYEDRLSDPDVSGNPRLEALIREYIEWYETELASREMTIREHYAIVTLHPRDLSMNGGRDSPLARLSRLPVLGVFARALGGQPSNQAAFDVLEERARAVAVGLRDIEGCHTTRVDAEDALSVLADYWRTQTPDNLSPHLREADLITPRQRE